MKKKVKVKYKTGLPVINHHAAGIDIGDEDHVIAMSDGKEGYEIYEFESFTEDLKEAVDLLVSKGITTVAMESTGVYWLNLYLLIEEAGIQTYLVNARHVKNVTGRKHDDTDAIWIQKLHSCGLLQKSFQPDTETRKLRSYVRQRKSLIRQGADNVRRMQKALELMNIKLHVVIRELTGQTGILVLESILKGNRDVNHFIKLKHPSIKCSDEEFKKSLEGIWNEEYLFMLEQAYESYQFYRKQIEACDKKIYAQLMKQLAIVREGDISGVEMKWKKKPKRNELHFNARPLLHAVFGVDLCAIDGIAELTTLELLSEIGYDFSSWKEQKYFTSWLNVCPNTKITGGKIISSRMQKKKNVAGQALRQAASTISRCKSPFGAYSRKMKSKLGKLSGTIVTTHKLARIIYAMVTQQKEYDDKVIKEQEEEGRLRKIKHMEKELRRLKRAS